MITARDLRIGNYYKGASRGQIERATGAMIAQLENKRSLNKLPIK